MLANFIMVRSGRQLSDSIDSLSHEETIALIKVLESRNRNISFKDIVNYLRKIVKLWQQKK